MRIAKGTYMTAYYIDPREPDYGAEELDVETSDVTEAMRAALAHFGNLEPGVTLRGIADGFGVEVRDFGREGITPDQLRLLLDPERMAMVRAGLDVSDIP